MKQIAIPGEVIEKGNKRILSGAYKDGDEIKSMYVGVVYNNDLGVKVVPLGGRYEPRVGDVIIGHVTKDNPFIYEVEINSYKKAVLPKRTMDRITVNVGEIILLKIISVNEVKDVDVEFMSKLYNGVLMNISSKKIARVIGKAKSMLELIQKYTETRLSIGANGNIYVLGDNTERVRDVINKIDEYSHVDNLTDKIEDYLKNN